jgi:hypothetical protein
MSTKVVDNPVGKLLSYPVFQTDKRIEVLDCLSRQQQRGRQISELQFYSLFTSTLRFLGLVSFSKLRVI